MPVAPKGTLTDSIKVIPDPSDADIEKAMETAERTGLRPDEIPPGSPADVYSYGAPAPYDPVRQSCSLVDLNTISGSSERLRNSLGGYFYTAIDSYGLLNVPPEFVTFDPQTNIHPNIFKISSIFGESVSNAPRGPRSLSDPDPSGMLARGFDPYGKGEFQGLQKTMIPTTRFVCRVEGDPSSKYLNDVLRGSKYWKTLWTGGDYLNSYIEPMFNEGVYDDHFTVVTVPYNKKAKNYLKEYSTATEFIGANYEYNRHFQKYQNYAKNIDSERKMPIWYMLNIIGSAFNIPSPVTGEYDEEYSELMLENYNIEYYTFGRKLDVRTINGRLAHTGEIHAGHPKKTPDWSLRSTMYIEEEFPMYYSDIPPKILNQMDHRNRNIIFDRKASLELLSDDSEIFNNAVQWPYYNKIEIEKDMRKGYFGRIMVEDQSDTLFMRTLKEVFLGQADTVPVTTMQFQKTSKYRTGSLNTMRDNIVTANHAVAYRSADFVKMLAYAYDNVHQTHEDFQIMGFSDLNVAAALDTRGLYRSINSKNIAKTITSTMKTFGDGASATKVSDIVSLLNGQRVNLSTTDRGAYDIEQLDALRPQPKENETIAYRVEKRATNPEGDSQTTRVLQNFWIFNAENMEDINLIDTQVKYDTDYTYTIYAYYIIRGIKYGYSNLQLSRIIGQVREDGYTGPLEFSSGPDGGPPTYPLGYCIEYYNPFTDQTVDDLLVEDSHYNNISDDLRESLSTLADDAQRIAVSSFRDSWTSRAYPPYVANFNVTVQPSLRVVEMPLLRKTYRVLDHPPNELDVVPGYTLKNDNTITFQINYQSLNPHKYPRPVTSADVAREDRYLNANDIIDSTLIQKETVSYQREVQVFRLDQKPTSFRDFETVIPKTISIGIDGSKFSYTTAVYDDIIKSNHKYYYLFRAVSANGAPGNVDTIIEAELVNDGGYKYGTFDVLFEEDLVVQEFRNPSTSFKNIFQISPNMSQTALDTTAVNFQAPLSQRQYDNINVGVAEDLIWGKTFKIRLTSKKTGKKIDLNITYRDPDINLANI